MEGITVTMSLERYQELIKEARSFNSILLGNERERIKYAMTLTDNREELAELCGIGHRTLFRKIKEYKL